MPSEHLNNGETWHDLINERNTYCSYIFQDILSQSIIVRPSKLGIKFLKSVPDIILMWSVRFLSNHPLFSYTNIHISDVYWTVHHCDNRRIKKPTRCHLLFYCTSYGLNMFQALLCPSSGARDYDVVYHIGLVVIGLLYVGGEVQLDWSGVRIAGSSCAWACNPDTTHSRELLMMGIVKLETCWTYKEYNKTPSDI